MCQLNSTNAQTIQRNHTVHKQQQNKQYWN